MKNLLILVTLLIATACSAPRVSDFGDIASTSAMLSQGGVELNPALNGLSDAQMPVALLGMKVAARTAIDEFVPEDQAEEWHQNFDVVNYFVTCNNIVIALGGANPAALIAGTVCGLITANEYGNL